MSHENEAIVRRWFEEIWNERREETIDELLTEGSVCNTDEGPMRGPTEFRQRQFQPFVAAFPDLRVTIDALLTQGEQVVVRWIATGTHTGDGLGFPATGQSVRFEGISWILVRDGKLVDGWQNSNIAAVIRQLAAPAPT